MLWGRLRGIGPWVSRNASFAVAQIRERTGTLGLYSSGWMVGLASPHLDPALTHTNLYIKEEQPDVVKGDSGRAK